MFPFNNNCRRKYFSFSMPYNALIRIEYGNENDFYLPCTTMQPAQRLRTLCHRSSFSGSMTTNRQPVYSTVKCLTIYIFFLISHHSQKISFVAVRRLSRKNGSSLIF